MTKLHTPSRRVFTGWLTSAAIAGIATQPSARESEASPIDRVPRHYSLKRFTSLSHDEVYRINHAARHGRQITIGRFPPSKTRQILRDAVADWPATRQMLLR